MESSSYSDELHDRKKDIEGKNASVGLVNTKLTAAIFGKLTLLVNLLLSRLTYWPSLFFRGS